MSEGEEMKAALLNFASSELTSHASTVVGISILEFTYLTAIFTGNILEGVSFDFSKIDFSLASTWQYMGLFCIFWGLNFALIFSVGRLMFYGGYANTIIGLSTEAKNAKDLRDLIRDTLNKEPGLRFISWFRSGLSLTSGFWFSLVAGFVVSIILFLLFFFR